MKPASTLDCGIAIGTKWRKVSRFMLVASFDISVREFSLLRYFYSHPGEVLSRDQLLNAVWGIDYYGTTRTLDQHIAQLRKKIEPVPSKPVIITTVHGVGYRYTLESLPEETPVDGL